MNRLRKERSLHLPLDSTPSERSRLVKTGLFSLFLHLSLVLFLTLNLLSGSSRSGRSVYRVTLQPFSPPGDGRPAGSSGSGLPRASEVSKPAESMKTETSRAEEGPKRHEPAEPARKEKGRAEKKEAPRYAKAEKKFEQPKESKPVEGLKKTDKKAAKPETSSGKSLEEAIEDIHRRVALDEIQKKLARRSGGEKATMEGSSKAERSAESQTTGPALASKGTPLIGSGTGTGTGPGSGRGTGTGSGGSPWGSSVLESKLNDYYSLIWAKIKDGWTLPENLSKEKADLEAIIVVVIEAGGKLQKVWFEKKSGNTLYDQMAMRAIRRAEPFPPIPKELGDDSLEIGIRFYPD